MTDWLKVVQKAAVFSCLYSRFSNDVTASIYWLPASRFYGWRHGRPLRSRGVNIDPFRHYWVRPSEIQRFSGRYGGGRTIDAIGSVEGGNWDRVEPELQDEGRLPEGSTAFEDHITYRSLEARFDRGVAWDETELVKYVKEKIQSGERFWGCETLKEVQRRCRRLDRLYSLMADKGYKRKIDLLGIKPHKHGCRLESGGGRYGKVDHVTRTGHNPVRGFRELMSDEIVVDVARDGEYLFVNGHHRLSISKLLNLERIPVFVEVRHSEWVDHLRERDPADSSESVHPGVEALRGTD